MPYLTLSWFRIALLVAIVAALLLPATGKRGIKGCANYGHACYGGHGKRSAVERSSDLSPVEQLLLRHYQQNSRNENDLERSDEIPEYLDESQINPPANEEVKSALLWKKLLLSSQQEQLKDMLAALEEEVA